MSAVTALSTPGHTRILTTFEARSDPAACILTCQMLQATCSYRLVAPVLRLEKQLNASGLFSAF